MKLYCFCCIRTLPHQTVPLSITAPLSSSGLDAEVTWGPEAVGTLADNWLDSGVDGAGPRRGLPLNNMPAQSLSIYGGRGSVPKPSLTRSKPLGWPKSGPALKHRGFYLQHRRLKTGR